MTEDKDYRFALLDRIEDLLDQHSQAIARLQERLDVNEELAKQVVALLQEMRDAVSK